MQLARCEYVERRENVIAIGNSGTGKTHVALGYGGSPRCCSDRIDAIGENRGPYPNSYQRVMVQEWSNEAKRRSGSGSHMGCDSACSYRRTGDPEEKSAVPGSVYKRWMRWWWYGAGLTGQYLRRKLTPKGREACAYDDNIGRANS